MNNLTTGASSKNQGSDSKKDATLDFIDFYQLLGADHEATTTALRRKINDLYTEAQSNRDHRNPAKRRRYEALCDLLPYCRIVLLDPDKRARYDRYREEHEAGKSIPDLESMMDEIAGRVDDSLSGANGEKIGLLAVKGDDDFLPLAPHHTNEEQPSSQRKGLFNKPSARSVATTPSAPSEVTEPVHTSASTRSAAPLDEEDVSRPRSVSTGGITPIGFAVLVFVLSSLTLLVFKTEWPKAFLVGVIAGIIAFVVGNSMATKTRSRRNRVE